MPEVFDLESCVSTIKSKDYSEIVVNADEKCFVVPVSENDLARDGSRFFDPPNALISACGIDETRRVCVVKWKPNPTRGGKAVEPYWCKLNVATTVWWGAWQEKGFLYIRGARYDDNKPDDCICKIANGALLLR